MKKTLFMVTLCALVGFSMTSCKEKGSTTPAETAAVQLTGTPAQNMITVMQLGVDALKNNPDAAVAATALKKVMASYNIADLRAASKAAKDAGQGASEQEKNQFKALQNEYKELAAKVGGSNPGAFNEAHAEWSKAWGIN